MLKSQSCSRILNSVLSGDAFLIARWALLPAGLVGVLVVYRLVLECLALVSAVMTRYLFKSNHNALYCHGRKAR